MNYFKVIIKFTDENKEQIESLLFLNGVQHILEEKYEFIIYIESSLEWKIQELKSNLSIVESLKDGDIIVSELEDKNWNEEWEKSIEPVNINEKIIVYPSWKHDDVKLHTDKILIEVDPKMSFGTGHNETTQMMLEMMSRHMTGSENKLLDYGCGTAVLAIAGAKIGVKNVFAIDNDIDAVENANENIVVNKVQDKVNISFSNLQSFDEAEFDIICANIIRTVIEETFDLMDSKLNPGGKIFLSGILHEEWQPVLKLLMDYNYSPVEINSKAEWLGIYAGKK